MPSPYSELAERFHVSSSLDEFDIITKYHLLGKVNTQNLSIESIYQVLSNFKIGNTHFDGWEFAPNGT